MTTPRSLRNLTFLILGPVLAICSLSAQMLARPGWVGSGIAPQVWYKHAVLYEIDTRTFADSDSDGTGDLKGITDRLDYIHSLGVDAILLESLTAPSQGTAGAHTIPIDPALGTLDDFDDLSLAASRLGIRVLLELPSPEPALARFWLTRGVAGFHIPAHNPAGQPNDSAIQAIRKLLPSYLGQRVLITETPPAKPTANDLFLDTALLELPSAQASAGTAAGQLRAALEHAPSAQRSGMPLLAMDSPDLPRALNRFGGRDESPANAAISRLLGTIVLLTRANSILAAGQELAFAPSPGKPARMPWGAPPTPPSPPAEGPAPLPVPPKPARQAATDAYVPYVAPTKPSAPQPAPQPDPASAAGQDIDPRSTLNFYRQLIQLHHGNSAVRDGDQTFLDEDTLNALIWVRTPPAPSNRNPPVVVLCNPSDKPLTLDLKPALARLHLRGNFLRTILRSDDALGSMDLSPVHVPPFGVFIGELKF